LSNYLYKNNGRSWVVLKSKEHKREHLLGDFAQYVDNTINLIYSDLLCVGGFFVDLFFYENSRLEEEKNLKRLTNAGRAFFAEKTASRGRFARNGLSDNFFSGAYNGIGGSQTSSSGGPGSISKKIVDYAEDESSSLFVQLAKVQQTEEGRREFMKSQVLSSIKKQRSLLQQEDDEPKKKNLKGAEKEENEDQDFLRFLVRFTFDAMLYFVYNRQLVTANAHFQIMRNLQLQCRQRAFNNDVALHTLLIYGRVFENSRIACVHQEEIKAADLTPFSRKISKFLDIDPSRFPADVLKNASRNKKMNNNENTEEDQKANDEEDDDQKLDPDQDADTDQKKYEKIFARRLELSRGNLRSEKDGQAHDDGPRNMGGSEKGQQQAPKRRLSEYSPIDSTTVVSSDSKVFEKGAFAFLQKSLDPEQRQISISVESAAAPWARNLEKLKNDQKLRFPETFSRKGIDQAVEKLRNFLQILNPPLFDALVGAYLCRNEE